jgi:hypothetical protein
VIIPNRQDAGAPSRHDPNETPDQISEDDLTINAPQDEDEATRTARRARNQHREECRARAAERARIDLHNLNREFDNVSDPIFNTPIAVVAEATMRLVQLSQNLEKDRTIQLTRHAVEQLERQNPFVLTPWHPIQGYCFSSTTSKPHAGRPSPSTTTTKPKKPRGVRSR